MPTPRRPARPAMILTIICLSYFMVILDNSIIFTGLPKIEEAMRFTPTGLTWVQDAYTLVFGGLLLGARSGDIVGRRRMFVIGLVLFALASLLVGLASLLVGLAPWSWWLIAARAFQGIGAAILAPSSLSLLTASFAEGHQRARAVAAYSAVAGIGASAGLVFGGVLADVVSWRAGFFLNVPIGVAMVFAAYRYIGETERRQGRFDLIGALCATGGMTALVFGIVDAAEVGWGAPSTIIAIALGIVLLAGLVVNEARAAQPIMPLRLFADRRRTGAYLVRMLYLGAMIGFFFFFTSQYLQGVLGFSPLHVSALT
ncbi:MFS transporter [Dactylosporangium sp. NPDC049742]|uniref:MFS transporter n=1 Tax=Dactylosporangium sp. NPDC049742 TaxID=3154737 RepID=UPI0034298F04